MRLFASELQDRLEEKQITLVLNDEAVSYIIEHGYDPVYGARPLKRFMQRKLETTIAKTLLGGDFAEGDTMAVRVKDDELVIEKIS